jgi:Zn finger protein HypA/HybF involved in hydrogenase expression
VHEAGLAQAILDTILGAAQGNRAQAVVRVDIEVGEVCLVNAQQLVFFLRELARGTDADEMAVAVTEVMTRIRCRDCSYDGSRERQPACLFSYTDTGAVSWRSRPRRWSTGAARARARVSPHTSRPERRWS